jgi:DNA processing protein
VSREVDLVALSLLWTEGADRKPIRRLPPPDPEAPDIAAPDPRTLVDLDEVLALLEVSDAGAKAADLRRRAMSALEEARTKGIHVVLRGCPDYPGRLESIPDPPPVLWVRGIVGPCPRAVAIVGSRFATPHGLEVGFKLGQGLAGEGFEVVSGLARGVDAAAHGGALRGGGRTIAVLGCGADVVYPPEHGQLAGAVAMSGALISEFAPGVPPHGWHFPRRNRLISGISLGVVIVEAAERSGSLITARCALEQGRSVMAVPGAVLSGRNRGAHALLRDGANVVEEARDVVELLLADWHRELAALSAASSAMGSDTLVVGESDPGTSDSSRMPSRVPAGPGGDPILRLMSPGETYRLEDLAAETGLAPVALMARLTRLEVGGWVLRVGGGRFVKAGANVLR